MTELATKTPIVQKTEELCETILAQEGVQALFARIDSFQADEGAQQLYQQVGQMQDVLMRKQQSGESLTESEIADFEKVREELMNHPVAGPFVESQQEVFSVQETISKYIAKTFELGRMPTEADLQDSGSGCCGGGGGSCGCS